MIISIIAAMDENRCIGKDNRLPWHLPADLRRFKALTMGHHLIMGRKTYESIGRPLPGRQSIIITHQNRYHAPGCQIRPSFNAAILTAVEAGEIEAFVIGGAQIFTQALPFAQRMYLTLIQAHYDCDIHFPAYNPRDWIVTKSITLSADPTFIFPYTFIDLIRKSELS